MPRTPEKASLSLYGIPCVVRKAKLGGNPEAGALPVLCFGQNVTFGLVSRQIPRPGTPIANAEGFAALWPRTRFPTKWRFFEATSVW
jgi:hypothetical protein